MKIVNLSKKLRQGGFGRVLSILRLSDFEDIGGFLGISAWRAGDLVSAACQLRNESFVIGLYQRVIRFVVSVRLGY